MVSPIQIGNVLDGKVLIECHDYVCSVNFDQSRKFTVVVVPEAKKSPVVEKSVTPRI